MSDLPPNNDQDQNQDQPAPDAGREASVQLSGAAPLKDGPGLDTANQSLFDALRITFRLLQAGMAVIAVLYVLSGFQSVESGQKGLRVLFGKVITDDVQPGFRFSFPFPMGEMVRVETTAAPLAIDGAFWPDNRGAATDSIESLPNSFDLNPARDGSLITSDGNIAHSRMTIVYERADAGLYSNNVHPEDEQLLVENAVRGAMITAVAATTIDDFLKNTSSDGLELDSRVRRIAQDRLDAMESGLSIRQVTIRDRIPPASLRDDFASVQEAQSKASERVTEAEKYARLLLTGAAGRAAESLNGLIDEYERLVELGRGDEAEAVLTQINSVFDGTPIEGTNDEISGEVTTLLNEASQYASTIVNRRSAQLAIYRAKLAQFEANPLLTVESSWREAYTMFLSRENVQLLVNPPGVSSMEVLINEDPDIAKEIDRARKKRENDAELQRRREQVRNQTFSGDN